DRLATRYRRLLDAAMRRPAPIFVGGGFALLCTVPLGAPLGAAVAPRIDESAFAFDIKRLPSVSLQEAVRLGEEVEKVLARFPESEAIVTRTGRAGGGAEPGGVG